MCLGELGRVESVDGDVAAVRTDRGLRVASLLLVPAAPGDDVVIHSGHVLAVLGAAQVATATALRAGDTHAVEGLPTPGPPGVRDPRSARRPPPEGDPWTRRTDEASSSRR